MTEWFAPYAWLGGPDFASDVSVAVANGVVASVDIGARPGPESVRLDGIILPGLANVHSHAFHRVIRGQTHESGGDFWQWRTAMYAVSQLLEPDSYRALAGEVFGEMLRSGITAVGEFHYVHHQPDGRPYGEAHAMERALIDAATDAGIRMTLLDTCYLASDVRGAPPLPEQSRFADASADDWSLRVLELESLITSPTIKLGVAAHSVRATPRPALEVVADTAATLDCPVHVHVSEQRAENDACLAEHGMSPTQLISACGLLNDASTAIHGTHLTGDDMKLLADSGAGVCFCPTTERELGDGIGPARELRDLGVPLSLGTDSNAVVDLFEEARSLELNDRLRLERRGIHSPVDLLHSATTAGLEALGWGTHAPLGVGSPADFLSVATGTDQGTFEPSDGVGALLFAGPLPVTDVVVGGRHVVKEGLNRNGQSRSGLASAIRGFLR